jgi:hypothetical protein
MASCLVRTKLFFRVPLPFAATVLVAAVAGFGQPPIKPDGPRLVLLDGSVHAFGALEITAGKLSGEGLPSDLTLDDLRSIEGTPSLTTAERLAIVVELRSGRLLAGGLTIADDKCSVAWTGGEELSLPIDTVRAIRFDPSASSPEFDKALATPSAEMDRVFLKDEAEKLASVTGLVKALTEQQLTVEIGGEERSIPCERLFGLVIAQPDANDSVPRCLVTFHDGSVLGGETISLTGGKTTLDLTGGSKATFAWSKIARVTLRSSRVAFLSDLKPVAEEQQAIVTLPRPWQRDKNVMGKPLTLGTRVFEKGIGVHARSSLTFAAERKWDVLAATIGIDAQTTGKGDCVFTILADGQPLFTRRMTGADSPHQINLPIEGCEQVMLLVEPGEGLDLADHGNWCDVRFIKNRK